MSIGICRVQKISGVSGGVGAYFHNERIKDHSNSNPDIDFSRSAENYHIREYDGAHTYNQRTERRLAEGYKGKRAVRKDAVKLVEVLFTSDKEFFDTQPDNGRAYFEDCLKWASERFGADNIIADVVHLDEKTPHMHIDFVPLTADGRLSAKELLGDKKQLQKLQDDFYENVGKKYGLDRGKRADLNAGEAGRPHLTTQELKAETLKKEISGLEADTVKLQTEKSTLESENASLTSQNAKIKAEIKQGKKEVNIINNMRNAVLNEYAAAAEATDQVKAFLRYTQIKEPKTDLGRRAADLWKDFAEFWKQKHPNYAEQKKESIRDKLNENRQTVARKGTDRPQQERQKPDREQSR